MYKVFQTVTKWASAPVIGWCATHGMGMCGTPRLYATEDDAFRAVCERIAELASFTRQEPEFETERRENHTVIRVFGVTWTVRKGN